MGNTVGDYKMRKTLLIMVVGLLIMVVSDHKVGKTLWVIASMDIYLDTLLIP